MKTFLLLLSTIVLTAWHSAHAFAPKSPVSDAAGQLVQKQLKQESSTALEAYAMGGYTNGNNLMYRSGGLGRYSGGYGGYGGYGYDRPYYSSYSLMPDEARRGYGGYYDRYYYNSPYRYGSGYGGYYNDRFDMNRRYSNGYGGYGGYNRYGRGYGGYYDTPGMEMARMRGAEEMRRRDYYGGRGYYGSGYYGNSYYGNGYNRYGGGYY
eukprot:CAMPEP_0170228600 /NCGR_PEP_ID=MMETSP0116_2-20130129/14020_1 /TAXON_ID=400756 /ORGANISM="Durinskia baltica, Strain CSIRO CS-38" /LENGTH=207 /DNA_ID=CAMNT_0010479343 /DNA_START=69 /DNA_END=692 /DNA_ORIENTATION=+